MASFHEVGRLRLNNNGTMSLQLRTGENNTNIDTSKVDYPDGPTGVPAPAFIESESVENGDSAAGTWELNGQSLKLSIGGDVSTVWVSPDGQFLMRPEFLSFADTEAYYGGGLKALGSENLIGIQMTTTGQLAVSHDAGGNQPINNGDAIGNGTVFIRNNGLADLKITGIDGNGSYSIAIPTTIGPGQSVPGTMTFPPGPGSVTLKTDDPLFPTFTVFYSNP